MCAKWNSYHSTFEHSIEYSIGCANRQSFECPNFCSFDITNIYSH